MTKTKKQSKPRQRQRKIVTKIVKTIKKSARRGLVPRGVLTKIEPYLQRHLDMVHPSDPCYAHLRKFANELHHDVLLNDVHLPSANYNGTLFRNRVEYQYTPVIGTSTANGFSLLLNPWLWCLDVFRYERLIAGVKTNYAVPTAIANSATSGNVFGAPADATTISGDGSLISTAASPYGGRVRCRGVTFEIIYSGQQANKGGLIYCLTNANKNSYISQTAATGDWQNTASTPAGLARQRQDISIHAIRSGFRFTWRPQDLDWHQIDGYVPDPSPVVAATTDDNGQVAMQYLPDSQNDGTSVTNGWETGFVVIPANATAATAAPYLVKVYADYEYSLRITEGASQGITVAPNNVNTYQHPMAHAAANNMLNQVHMNRRQHTASINATSLGADQFRPLAENAAEMAGSFAAALGEGLVGSL